MELSYNFVFFVVVLVMTVVTVNSVTESQGDAINVLNNYTLNLTENPHDGDTLKLDGYMFEFDSDGLYDSNNIPVSIALDIGDTCNNLRYAIKDNNTRVKVS